MLQFHQDEVSFKPLIVQSIINAQLGNTRKIFARKTEIRKLSREESKVFFTTNHLMGDAPGATAFALCLGAEIVAAITVRNRDGELEIVRYANALNTTVVAGISKLLAYVEREYKPKTILSFVDRRYADGHSLVTLGFKEVSTTLGWKWTDGVKTYNRLHCRADKARGLTEKQNAEELGLSKIYDAGQTKFIKHLK